MNLEELQRKLVSAARAAAPGDQVPYAFERRIVQQIKNLRAVDSVSLWAQGLWRAAAPCVGLALIAIALSLLSGPKIPAGPDMSQEFENTVFAAANADSSVAEPLR
ncbi:MAG TPA: hypothetical protein VKY92_00160 [Verrucomicrobiae bacterium]|nr:hypothetical protein [Verrucomicrobiae bacterium]